ncbi:MAG TPA: hypothetical protein VF574_14855 [Allosphingosinicella sp.]|jgi:hypothetical protein
MAADLSPQDQSFSGMEREPWEAPRVTRFSAAGARAGNTTSSADGSTDKS